MDRTLGARRRLSLLRGLPRPIPLLIACSALLIVAVAGGTAVLLSSLRAQTLANRERQQQNLALVLAEQTDRSFQSLQLVQNSLIDRMRSIGIESRADLARQMSDHNVFLMLRDKINGLPQIDAVTLIDENGKLINFSRYWPIPKVNVADRDYFKALKASPDLQSFVSAPVPNRGTGTWTIYLARRIDGPDHQFLGMVLGAMRLSYFEDFYKKIVGGSERSITLFRDDGVMLARYPHVDPSIGRSYLLHGAFRRVLAAADRGAVYLFSRIDNTTRIVAAHKLAHYPIVVTVSITERAALAAWREEAYYLAGFAGLMILLIIGATAAVARQFLSHALIVRLNAEKAEVERARAVAETALLRQERLSVLGQLTATVAHELRNPLSAIRNTIHTINELAAAKGVALDRPVGRVERSIARCDKIISNLLDYTRTRELALTPTRLDRWLGDVLDDQKIPDGITLERRFRARSALVALDSDRFQRVVINLLENAVQALGEGAALMGERKVTVATHLAERAEILIEDTGSGIPPDILPRIFEPLFSTKSFGTGLGLPTVRQIVEQHGGEIAVTSEPGRGTSVRIRLPIATQSSAAA